MKNIFKFMTMFVLIFAIAMAGCVAESDGKDKGESDPNNESEIVDENEIEEIPESSTAHNFKLISSSSGSYYFECQDEGCEESATLNATCSSGTECIQVSDDKIIFGEITEDTGYAISGNYYGNIEIDVGEDYEFELSLQGLTLTAETDVPINVISGDKVVISAKKSTDNYIYDNREEVSEEGISASIYSAVDLDVQGKGNLYIKSINNNGIHTKDELSIKNLSLQVDCVDNALKGNDGVYVESGSLVLISRKGDGIKTTNSHLSAKGKQKGDVIISGGEVLIYSACDGIDSAHNVNINQDDATVNLQIFTDKYSKYSEEVTAITSGTLYIKSFTTSYKYSIEYSNDSKTVWCNSSTYTTSNDGMGGERFGSMGGSRYYYKIDKPSGYTKLRLFIYSSSQSQGQAQTYTACTDYLTINTSCDTIELDSRGSEIKYGWTNYSTQNRQPGGETGNTEKGDYSTKGLKADNEIAINGGSIVISAYDDAIHTNNDVQLGEEGAYYYGTGDIAILGGEITIHSNDDGIHADGELNINDGTIKITNSYEGLEGSIAKITGGDISVKSSDDGINTTSDSGVGITISGGNLYVYAGGDGLDANSRTQYQGIVITGGKIVVISTGISDSALDTENGYTYSGGYVVAIGRSGGMNERESIECSNFSSVGTSKTLSLSNGSYLVVSSFATIKMPTNLSALVVVLGRSSASITNSSSEISGLDDNGVLWQID